MRRRDFIKVVVGSATTLPLAARAQLSGGIRHVGVLMAYAESDPEAQAWFAASREELQKLGWVEDHTIRIDIRWAGASVESIERSAKELVALKPELILSSSTPSTAALLQQTRTLPIILMKSRRRIAFPRLGTTLTTFRLQQRFADREMGFWSSLHGSNPEPLTSALGQKQTRRNSASLHTARNLL